MMIVTTTNIFLAPVAVVIWAVDVYLFLAALRLILSLFSASWAERLCRPLKNLVDLVPNAIRQWLEDHKDNPGPTWLPWVITLGGGIVLKHLLLSLLV